MLLPRPRGPLSEAVVRHLSGSGPPEPGLAVARGADILDLDCQLALWTLYELSYRGFDDADGDHEHDSTLVRLREELADAFEAHLRAATRHVVDQVPDEGDFAELLLAMIDADTGPSTAPFLHRQATRDQLLGWLRQRSVYHLKESDPHTFVLPRLEGPAKAALAELQYDEYGGGRPERLHQKLFAAALEAAGLDSRYGAYLGEATAETLATNNVMSLFCLRRRLRGAATGHLAAFEATSSVPSRRIATGIERLGMPDAVAAYFHEHVEADSVHEQLAARAVCGALVAAEPGLRLDVLFGAAACLYLDALSGRAQLERWEQSAPESRAAS